jgi:hypothetical protein
MQSEIIVLNDVTKLLETKCQDKTSWGREKKIRKKKLGAHVLHGMKRPASTRPKM